MFLFKKKQNKVTWRTKYAPGWKYGLVIDTTFFAFLLSIFADSLLSIFLLIIAFSVLFTFYRFVESLYFTFASFHA